MTDTDLVIRPARPEDLTALHQHLGAAGLPFDDVTLQEQEFLLGFLRGALVASAGLECRGTSALLRSLAVSEPSRGAGRGSSIYRAILARAKEQGVTRLYLLTETAAAYFAARGFSRVDRCTLPPEIAGTAQARGGCCSRAACMVLMLS